MDNVIFKKNIWSCHCEGFVRSNLLNERLPALSDRLHPTKYLASPTGIPLEAMTENQKIVKMREGNIA